MKKFKRAVTDSETGPGSVRFDRAEKPGVSTLLEIIAAATGRTPQDVAERSRQYGPLKADTGEAVVALLEPIQAALPRADGRPRRAGPPAAGRGRQGPHRRVGDARSGHELPSGCCPLDAESDRSADHPARAFPHSGRSPSSRSTCSSTRRSSGASAPTSWPASRSPSPCSPSSCPGSNFLTYGTTERVARRLGAGRIDRGRRRRRAGDVAVGARRR